MKLKERTAIVTGASSGIGRGIALSFAREGANVIVADVKESPTIADDSRSTAEVIRDEDGNAIYERTDVTVAEEVKAMVDTSARKFDGVDILVNAAGVTNNKPVRETSEKEWDRIYEVNVNGVYRCSKETLPYVLESDFGRIINISSQRGLKGGESPENAAYVSSKAAVSALTRQMARDYGPEGVTVNAICPGPIKSGMNPVESQAERERLLDGTLTPFIGVPEDIAPAAILLASDDGRYIHGHNLVIDGGNLIL